MSVDSGVPTADPPNPNSRKESEAFESPLWPTNGTGVGFEFLSQTHGDSILHVGTSGFENLVELFFLLLNPEASKSNTG
jgi:hypothetical protein